MTVRQIAENLEAQVFCGAEKMDLDIQYAFSSDMMSDVLAFVQGSCVLLTGMVNAHVIRTAEMVELECIVFVRGKRPPDDIIEMAQEGGIAVLSTQYTLYTTSGLLYAGGLPGVVRGGAVCANL